MTACDSPRLRTLYGAQCCAVILPKTLITKRPAGRLFPVVSLPGSTVKNKRCFLSYLFGCNSSEPLKTKRLHTTHDPPILNNAHTHTNHYPDSLSSTPPMFPCIILKSQAYMRTCTRVPNSGTVLSHHQIRLLSDEPSQTNIATCERRELPVKQYSAALFVVHGFSLLNA